MFQYSHRTHPRARNIKIRVQPPDQVVVVTPPWVRDAEVAKFVDLQQVWIETQLQKVKRYNFGETDYGVTIFGKTYQKTISYQPGQPSGITINTDYLTINPLVDPAICHPAKLKTTVSRQLNSFLKQTAAKYITPRTQALSTQMNLTYRQLTLRAQKTRWGSCSTQQNLNFNWRLVHCPTEVIDYVIIHELAHLAEMNHSSRFWQLVAKHDPAHREHRGWLKRQGLGLT